MPVGRDTLIYSNNGIDVRVTGTDRVVRNLRSIAKNIEDNLDEGCEEAGNMLVEAIQEIMGDPSQLASNADSTIELKGDNSPLVETGSLRDGFYIQTSNRSRKHVVHVLNDDPRMKWHMAGYTTSPDSAFPEAYVPSRDPVKPVMKQQSERAKEIIAEAVYRALE